VFVLNLYSEFISAVLAELILFLYSEFKLLSNNIAHNIKASTRQQDVSESHKIATAP
jgi:hypothetical protein